RRLVAGRLDECATMVPGTEATEGSIVRPEVIDARGEPGHLTAHDVEIDMVERARAGGRPVEDLATRVGHAPGDAGAVVEKLRQRDEARNALGSRAALDARDRLEGRDVDGGQLAREDDR